MSKIDGALDIPGRVSEALGWLEAAIKCKEWNWSPDQHMAALYAHDRLAEVFGVPRILKVDGGYVGDEDVNSPIANKVHCGWRWRMTNDDLWQFVDGVCLPQLGLPPKATASAIIERIYV